MGKNSLKERLYEKLMPIPEAGCFIFMGYIEPFGHGKIAIENGKNERTHRVAWILEYGEIPEGMCVLHKCDVPSCCNVNHLFLGCRSDNNKDKMKKLRASKKLTKKAVIAIRDDERLYKEIAADYDISISMVSQLKTKKSWGFI